MSIHATSRTLVALAALAPVTAMLVAAAPAGGATIVVKDSAPQVSLCHRTNSATNPYVRITIDANAVVRQGHDGHVGPVWNPTLKPAGIKWGDVIPAFDYTTNKGVTQHYSGMNTASLSIIAAGCKVTLPVVVPQAPTVVASTVCGVEGTYTIPTTAHVGYLLNGTPIAAGTYYGPKTGTVTARAEAGYTLSNPTWSYALSLAPAAACPGSTVVTPKAPTVVASTICEVEGTYTIPATAGVIYLRDGKVIAAGPYKGPITATITAMADTGYTLSTSTWSYALRLGAAEVCPIDVDAPQADTGEAVTAPPEETTLAKTGASTTGLATIGALATLMGAVLLALGSRRVEENEM